MYTNGTISYKAKDAEPATDEYGVPIESTGTESAWSDPIECLIQTNKHENTGSNKGGVFTMAKYNVLMESSTPITADMVRLTRQGQSLGDFPVQDNQLLETVGRVKITV
ncbi:hypothetical protein [uncultured Bacteroides sp.]|uniref:hypothetical protein n=1 Tax=uncultured Bacteroides sp. TaxID=162156 RepID=UPI002AAC2B7D|nr:hypothetical protein [uncultured Bacteroides sp.]